MKGGGKMISEDLAVSILDELKAMRERIDELEKLVRDEMEVKDETAGKEGHKGFSLAGLLETDPLLRSIVLDLTKMGGASLSDLARRADADEETIRGRLKRLKDMGYVKETIKEGKSRYQAVMAKKQPRKVPKNIWNALKGRVKKDS